MSDVIDQAAEIEVLERRLRIEAAQAQAGRLADAAAPVSADCDDCGDEIDPERRRVLPGARTCVWCAEARERRQRGL